MFGPLLNRAKGAFTSGERVMQLLGKSDPGSAPYSRFFPHPTEPSLHENSGNGLFSPGTLPQASQGLPLLLWCCARTVHLGTDPPAASCP